MTKHRDLFLGDIQLPSPPVDEDTVVTAVSLWAWSVVAGVVLGGFGLQVPIALATLPFDGKRAIVGRYTRDLAVLVSKLNPLWDFRIHGELPDYRPARTVVVANHVSNSDVFLLSHLPWEMKWLAKESLFKVPFFGWLLAVAGDIPVKRGTRDSVKDAMERCREYLEKDVPVMIFPEGTRSAGGDLQPFKDGAFRLAIETKADVLPMAVAGTRDALPKHSWRFGFARGRVAVGTPITTAGMTLDDIEALKAEAREQVVHLTGLLEQD